MIIGRNICLENLPRPTHTIIRPWHWWWPTGRTTLAPSAGRDGTTQAVPPVACRRRDADRCNPAQQCLLGRDDGAVSQRGDGQPDRREPCILEQRRLGHHRLLHLLQREHGGFRNVTIDNIEVYDTFRSAIAIETVDGGGLENVRVTRVQARNTGNPLFIRLGHRAGEKPGYLRNIYIGQMKVEVPFGRPDEDYDLRGPAVTFFHNPIPSSVTGIPGSQVENVVIEDVETGGECGDRGCGDTLSGQGNEGDGLRAPVAARCRARGRGRVS